MVLRGLRDAIRVLRTKLLLRIKRGWSCGSSYSDDDMTASLLRVHVKFDASLTRVYRRWLALPDGDLCDAIDALAAPD